jgi:inorganic pyrophosphatase
MQLKKIMSVSDFKILGIFGVVD